MDKLTETGVGPEFLLSEANGRRSRKNIVIAASQTLLCGAALGALLYGAVTRAAKGGGNTGGGTLTLDTTQARLAGVQVGVYQVRNVGGSFSAAATDVPGSGKGAITLASPAFDSSTVKIGVYRITFIEPTTNLGTFVVEDPDGIEVGSGVAGTAFTGVVKFTIADGSTDFVAGDVGLITVTAATATNSGKFSVTSPSGVVLGYYTVGDPAFTHHVKFTMADVGTDFAVGDGFDITVAAGAGTYVAHDPAGVDGRETFAGYLYDGVTTGAGETANAVAIVRDAEVITARISWNGHTTDQKTAVLAAALALGIVAR